MPASWTTTLQYFNENTALRRGRSVRSEDGIVVPEQKVSKTLIHDQVTSKGAFILIKCCHICDISNQINAVFMADKICVNCAISRADFSSLLTGVRSPLLFKRNAIHIGHRGHRACSKCISRVHFLIDLGSIFWDTNCLSTPSKTRIHLPQVHEHIV